MSTPDTLHFFSKTMAQAESFNVQTTAFAEGQGIVLFASEVRQGKKLHLLRQCLQELSENNGHTNPVLADSAAQNATVHCQVTAEEKAQLFAFLNK